MLDSQLGSWINSIEIRELYIFYPICKREYSYFGTEICMHACDMYSQDCVCQTIYHHFSGPVPTPMPFRWLNINIFPKQTIFFKKSISHLFVHSFSHSFIHLFILLFTHSQMNPWAFLCTKCTFGINECFYYIFPQMSGGREMEIAFIKCMRYSSRPISKSWPYTED